MFIIIKSINIKNSIICVINIIIFTIIKSINIKYSIICVINIIIYTIINHINIKSSIIYGRFSVVFFVKNCGWGHCILYQKLLSLAKGLQNRAPCADWHTWVCKALRSIINIVIFIIINAIKIKNICIKNIVIWIIINVIEIIIICIIIMININIKILLFVL